MKIFNRITVLIILTYSSLAFYSCEQERLEDALEIADGAGTLTSYMAYQLDSVAGTSDVYGRAVFWKGLEGYTYLQISLNNVPSDAVYPSAVYAGSTTASGSELMELYTIENTGEGYDFGEFSTSKYYVITTDGFYDGLQTYDANIKVMAGSSDNTIIALGDIGINADPVETN
ncbi:hypothetical protein [Marinoscillum pacificum]|uniref:hypothetical protein n=1 Tax=Marinoscillum pacificum TaxID=392723 RepID=UPI0021580180|nr:hypothetical protein [Marinoscillum pacificum]